MYRPPGYQPLGYSPPRYTNTGLTAYAANNSTAMAVPLELNLDDIARLDQDMTTHAFREDFAHMNRPQPVPMYYDNENINYDYQYHQQQPAIPSSARRIDEVGRLVADIAGPPSSEGYPALTPLPLRRSTSDIAKQKIVLTPPTSSSPHLAKDNVGRIPLAPISTNRMMPTQAEEFSPVKADPNAVIYELQCMYEKRITDIRNAEQERFNRLDAEYKEKLNRLQKDMNGIVEKQESVMRLKDEVESDLQKDLQAAREDLKKEQEKRRAERGKYEARIQELQGRIEELQRRVKKVNSCLEGVSDKQSFQAKLTELQQEHDRKTSNLIRQFEREKQSALEIMKTRVRSEVNLLVPRIRKQCQDAFNEALHRCQEQTATRYREKYGALIKRLKDDHQAERRFIQKQARDAAEKDKAEWQKRIKAKYEMKALEVKNECERRLLVRMRSKPSNVSFSSTNDSIMLSENDSFLM